MKRKYFPAESHQSLCVLAMDSVLNEKYPIFQRRVRSALYPHSETRPRNRHKPAYFQVIGISFFILLFIIQAVTLANPIQRRAGKDTIVVKPGYSENGISAEWKNVLVSRMNSFHLDSFTHLQRTLTKKEKAWEKLIIAKARSWNTFKDSLSIPFKDVEISETIYVLTGYLGDDDGFTYGSQTVCLDLTALNRAYGEADLPENDNRIDRIFALEYTHLLHKSWARKKIN